MPFAAVHMGNVFGQARLIERKFGIAA